MFYEGIGVEFELNISLTVLVYDYSNIG